MKSIKTLDIFDAWLGGLKDMKARIAIARRLERASNGNYGDHKRFDTIIEFRIDMGPGYRVYAFERGAELIIIMNGGDKRSQKKDIARAKALAEELQA